MKGCSFKYVFHCGRLRIFAQYSASLGHQKLHTRLHRNTYNGLIIFDAVFEGKFVRYYPHPPPTALNSLTGMEVFSSLDKSNIYSNNISKSNGKTATKKTE